ncbi:MAG: methyltransferase domain-containing protein [Planctomycetes bacterium]|nr:methyltransferase domain-containing protein [Planctomycetota bacterium]
MPPRVAAHRVFLQEFFRTFHTTGAVLPSSRFLGAALARFVRERDADRPLRILEVGPGTGAVTQQIVKSMKSGDALDLAEINPTFVQVLQRRFASEPEFQAIAGQTRVFCGPVEDLESGEPYDVLISGLPLNNFSVDEVERILETFRRLARPGGTLSFFEYIAVRAAKSVISPRRSERERLKGVGRTLDEFLAGAERQAVWRNIPPAWVHHVRLGDIIAKPQA